jgi:hypothetical protein
LEGVFLGLHASSWLYSTCFARVEVRLRYLVLLTKHASTGRTPDNDTRMFCLHEICILHVSSHVALKNLMMPSVDNICLAVSLFDILRAEPSFLSLPPPFHLSSRIFWRLEYNICRCLSLEGSGLELEVPKSACSGVTSSNDGSRWLMRRLEQRQESAFY